MELTVDEKLADELAKYYDDPLGYVMFVFPWDTDTTIQMVELAPIYQERFNCRWGPDEWACEFLDDLGAEIRERGFDGHHSVRPIRFATASGHGIGKSTLVAWLIKFILDTRPMSKGIVTANTSDQLRTKTWAELAKWHQMSITEHLYQYTSGRGSMSLYRKGTKKIQQNWRVDAQTCREENSEAFQGLHAAGSTPFYIFDEASGIPNKIWEARAGGATDGEPMSFDFGNPTRKSGMFYENCIGQYSHRYRVRNIDSRSVSITNKELFKEWAEDWGEDSDFFKVKVRGVFPSAGSVQFISTDDVLNAMTRTFNPSKYDPLLIGVDVARFGDNETVIYPRIGLDAKSFPFKTYRGLDNYQVAEKVIDMIQEFLALGKKCTTLFVDGGGHGSGVVDILRRLGYNPIDVNFGNKSTDNKFRYRGDEMWGKMRAAMDKIALPRNSDLQSQLTQREYGYTISGGKLHLESKKDMIKRGIQSPDIADALALTFDKIPELLLPTNRNSTVTSDYDTLEVKW